MTRALTGFDRMVFTKEWIKRGMPPTKEKFIKKVCEVENIVYTPPLNIKKDRDLVITKQANMFPTSKQEKL